MPNQDFAFCKLANSKWNKKFMQILSPRFANAEHPVMQVPEAIIAFRSPPWCGIQGFAGPLHTNSDFYNSVISLIHKYWLIESSFLLWKEKH